MAVLDHKAHICPALPKRKTMGPAPCCFNIIKQKCVIGTQDNKRAQAAQCGFHAARLSGERMPNIRCWSWHIIWQILKRGWPHYKLHIISRTVWLILVFFKACQIIVSSKYVAWHVVAVLRLMKQISHRTYCRHLDEELEHTEFSLQSLLDCPDRTCFFILTFHSIGKAQM